MGLAAALTGLSAACSSSSLPREEPGPAILWPLPPETPRIRFVNSISGPADIGIKVGALGNLWRFLVGKADVPMVNPHGLATDSEGRLYVVDNFLRMVHVFDPVRNQYHAFSGGADPLLSPIGVAVDDERGRVYVSDSAAAVVRVFTKDGLEPAGEIRGSEVARPTGLAVHEGNEELLVVDTTRSAIVRFSLTDHRPKGIIGSAGNEPGRFHSPTHVAVSAAGSILVTDSLNYRVQVLTPEGESIRSFGAPGDGPGYFSRPKGVAVDSDQNIYVVDALFSNVQIFDSQGRLLMAFGTPGRAHGEFWLPSGIFIDGQDRIYVSDSYNRRVQVFQYLKQGEHPQ